MSSEEEDFFNNEYYVHNRRFLTVVGLWPYQKTFTRLRYVCFIIVVMFSGIILHTHIIMESELTDRRIADLMQTYLPTLCFTFTYCDLLYNSAAMRTCLNRVRSDWNGLTDEAELIMMKKYAGSSRLICLIITCTFYIYITTLICPSVSYLFLYVFGIINDTQLILPVKDETFYANQWNFFLVMFVVVIIIITMCTTGIAYYTMLVACAQHVCGLFAILTMKIKKPFLKDTYKIDWASNDIKHYDEFQWIIEIIKYHDNTINFFELFKLLYGGSYIMQVPMALLFIILDFVYLFQILDFAVTMKEAIRNSIFIIGNMFMIYSSLYLGQRIIDHSIDVYTECCLIPFYKLSTETNKLLLLFTMRCNKQCEFSFRGLIIASHELFTKIMKTSLSCATVFYNMRSTAT